METEPCKGGPKSALSISHWGHPFRAYRLMGIGFLGRCFAASPRHAAPGWLRATPSGRATCRMIDLQPDLAFGVLFLNRPFDFRRRLA